MKSTSRKSAQEPVRRNNNALDTRACKDIDLRYTHARVRTHKPEQATICNTYINKPINTKSSHWHNNINQTKTRRAADAKSAPNALEKQHSYQTHKKAET